MVKELTIGSFDSTNIALDALMEFFLKVLVLKFFNEIKALQSSICHDKRRPQCNLLSYLSSARVRMIIINHFQNICRVSLFLHPESSIIYYGDHFT